VAPVVQIGPKAQFEIFVYTSVVFQSLTLPICRKSLRLGGLSMEHPSSAKDCSRIE
jgi:hypothetical protein